MAPPRAKYPRLWKGPDDDSPHRPRGTSSTSPDEEILQDSTASLINARASRFSDLVPSLEVPDPPRHPLLAFVARSLPVCQELALTSLHLSRHRMLVNQSTVGGEENIVDKQAASASLVFLAMLVTIYFAGPSRGNGRVRQRDKVAFRIADSALLALILRLLSEVLRTLTASYSSDTVTALALGGMGVHLLACDYAYANGATPDCVVGEQEGERQGKGLIGGRGKRPTFHGGTVSLNAALFSTTLLASRLPTDGGAFGFVSTSVVMFAFYPEARHTIAASKTRRSAVLACYLVTVALSIAAMLLLVGLELVAFILALSCVCVVSPVVRWWLQQYKTIIVGPWDIAHVVVRDDLSQSGFQMAKVKILNKETRKHKVS